MDLVMADNNQVLNPQSDGSPRIVEEKRPRVEENGGELGGGEEPLAKRMRKVAEIVLVLSGLGRMRGGGKSPTGAEAELMRDTRAKLAQMCEEFGLKPWDLVGGRDAVGAVVEDLGLRNERLKGLGFHHVTPRLSISEKILVSKRKMEEAKKYTVPAPNAAYASPLENRGTPHTVRMLPSDRPSHAPMSSGGFPISSPPVLVPSTTAPSPGQVHTSEVRVSKVSSGLPSGHLGRESSSLAVPRVERPHQRVEGGLNVSHAPPVQANSSVNHPLVNTPAWSVQPQPASSVKARSENKVSNHAPAQVEGSVNLSMSGMASQASKDQNFRPFITQTAPGILPSMSQSLQGVNIVQAPSFGSNGNDTSKIVQRLLQPQLPQHPTWTPPSREYMNKALTCQTCGVTINDVEGVLVCDACEKGFHLKCIPNLKGIPRGAEWHCMRCLALSHGKPLPPKYGRVMRSTNAPKIPSNTIGLQAPSDKKVGTLDPKVNQQKIMSNGSSGLQTPAGSGSVSSSSVGLASNSNISNASIVQGNNLFLSGKDFDQIPSSGTHANDSTQAWGAVCDSSAGSSSERCAQLKQISESTTGSESQLQWSSTSSAAVGNIQLSQNPQNVQAGLPDSAEVPLKSCPDNNSVMAGIVECSSRPDVRQEEREVAHTSPVGNSGPITEAAKHASSDNFHSVEWIGDVFQVVDEKKIYQSCCIDGVTYKVRDHALFCSGHDKLIPYKLQGMWEDSKTGSKWVIVKRCYFPSDLPESVAHPSNPVKDEVYESTSDSTVVAGLIRGPCEVLPPSKFEEVNEGHSQLGTESNKGSQPVFLCKWQYDEFKGTFQPVSS